MSTMWLVGILSASQSRGCFFPRLSDEETCFPSFWRILEIVSRSFRPFHAQLLVFLTDCLTIDGRYVHVQAQNEHIVGRRLLHTFRLDSW